MLILVWFVVCIIFYFVQLILGDSGHSLELFAVLTAVALLQPFAHVFGRSLHIGHPVAMVNAQQGLVDGTCGVALRKGDVLLDELIHLGEATLDGVRAWLILWYE